jgi:RimK family alpha-L-glutamate ligase
VIGIIASELDWNVRELMREIQEKGEKFAVFSITDFQTRVSGMPKVRSGDSIADDMRCIFVRWVSGGSAEQIIYRMDVLHRLENMEITVINPSRAIEQCADKYYTCSLLEDAGIPTPETVCTEHYADALKAVDEMGDVIVKPLFGSQGIGVMRIQNRDLAHRLFRVLDYGRSVFYIQKYVPHENEDYRAFVMGDEVIASMKRKGTSWKTNFSQGAEVESVQLSDSLEDMAVRASKTLGCKYAGVDILPGEDEYYVIEVNSIPGWRGLQSVSDFCIAEKIIDFFL